jgi:hypothetical protein
MILEEGYGNPQEVTEAEAPRAVRALFFFYWTSPVMVLSSVYTADMKAPTHRLIFVSTLLSRFRMLVASQLSEKGIPSKNTVPSSKEKRKVFKRIL